MDDAPTIRSQRPFPYAEEDGDGARVVHRPGRIEDREVVGDASAPPGSAA